MDAHRITGAIKQLAGGAQEAAGAVTGVGVRGRVTVLGISAPGS